MQPSPWPASPLKLKPIKPSQAAPSSDQLTPLSALTCATLLDNVKRASAISPDMRAVCDFLSTMKHTVSTLSATIDCLGDQTLKVIELGPAIQLGSQVSRLPKEVSDYRTRQEARVEEAKKLLESVVKQVSAHLKSRLDDIIREVVEKKVEERVRKELSEQIPESLRQQVIEHQRQIFEVQTNLHNSEARRHNATLLPTSLSDPLRPLLRPLPTPLQSPNRLASNTSVPPTPFLPVPPVSTPTTAIKPTPSPLFPKTIEGLLTLGADDTRRLIKEYGLEGIPEEADGGGGGGGDGEAKIDETDYNKKRFMEHIGVPFHVPVPTKTKSRQQLSVITNFPPE